MAKQKEYKTLYDIVLTANELRNLMENPIKSNRYYARLKRSLRKFTKFSFRNTKHFTPAQKSAITRAWNRYGGFVKDEVKGHKFKILKITRKQRSQLGQRYIISNRGLIISSDSGSPILLIKKKKENIIIKLKKIADKKWKKRGMSDKDVENMLKADEHFSIFPLNLRPLIVTQKKMLLDIFFPILPNEKIDDLAAGILVTLLPNSIHLAVNKSKGTTPYTPDSWEGYRSTLIYMDKKIREEEDYEPFKGIHASWIMLRKKTCHVKKD